MVVGRRFFLRHCRTKLVSVVALILAVSSLSLVMVTQSGSHTVAITHRRTHLSLLGKNSEGENPRDGGDGEEENILDQQTDGGSDLTLEYRAFGTEVKIAKESRKEQISSKRESKEILNDDSSSFLDVLTTGGGKLPDKLMDARSSHRRLHLPPVRSTEHHNREIYVEGDNSIKQKASPRQDGRIDRMTQYEEFRLPQYYHLQHEIISSSLSQPFHSRPLGSREDRYKSVQSIDSPSPKSAGFPEAVLKIVREPSNKNDDIPSQEPSSLQNPTLHRPQLQRTDAHLVKTKQPQSPRLEIREQGRLDNSYYYLPKSVPKTIPLFTNVKERSNNGEGEGSLDKRPTRESVMNFRSKSLSPSHIGRDIGVGDSVPKVPKEDPGIGSPHTEQSRRHENASKMPGWLSASQVVVDGIYWSEEVKRSIPKGVSVEVADRWINKTRRLGFQSLTPPDWNKCGRPQNGFVTLEDGTEMCARYRHPHDHLVMGEVLSYWLSRLLSLDCVPPVSLSLVSSAQWAELNKSKTDLGWEPEQYVALIMWIKDMNSSFRSKVLMPQAILHAYKTGVPVSEQIFLQAATVRTAQTNQSSDHNDVTNSGGPEWTVDELVAVAQWSSMIVFDYLTANYDRVASMQDGAEEQRKPEVIEESIRNLRRSRDSAKLWLIDNESGFLDAYDLMYTSPHNGHRFFRFHDQMLKTVCVFQRSLVDALRDLHAAESPRKKLEEFATKSDPFLRRIPKSSVYRTFEEHFDERLNAVIDWVDQCERRGGKDGGVHVEI
ncbi:uncharacterized protein LOC101849855 [Aplysia californica]|uniref:Uncharacterized protein LOC101849855 n=1 Tax=Aplysia californica TaxID=6500 RepID=A0ABM0JUT9_APLCA|nr:uncharacterized protein LOC101849855 [Aplysia californica]